MFVGTKTLMPPLNRIGQKADDILRSMLFDNNNYKF